MSINWSKQYDPKDDINESIYEELLIDPSEEEWISTIVSMPNSKAGGPSKIVYESLKHLGPKTNKVLFNLVCACFCTGLIPNDWKDALVYAIPKPTAWEGKLKNTRPITLLETARKVMTKLFTNRLSNILVRHNVLKGGNFAGLPGGSCSTPIQILDSIVNNAKINKQELWILSQDISKAFDSIDVRILDLALQRIKILVLARNLISNLFTSRTNRVIQNSG